MCLGARERSRALVVLVDVDEAVAFLHLAGVGGDEVDGARGAVANEVDAVFVDGFLDPFWDVRKDMRYIFS